MQEKHKNLANTTEPEQKTAYVSNNNNDRLTAFDPGQPG